MTLRAITLSLLLAAALLAGCATTHSSPIRNGDLAMPVHYVEIVTPDVSGHCAMLAAAQGLTFGDAVADLGGAHVAETAAGTLVGVRAPLAAHEEPIVRVYMTVDDIQAAVAAAEAAGAMTAYPPTRQGDTGMWAIVLREGVQHGFWQR